MEKVVILQFNKKETAKAFMSWMCDAGGEQDFWAYLEMDDKRPSCNDFDYGFKQSTITERA